MTDCDVRSFTRAFRHGAITLSNTDLLEINKITTEILDSRKFSIIQYFGVGLFTEVPFFWTPNWSIRDYISDLLIKVEDEPDQLWGCRYGVSEYYLIKDNKESIRNFTMNDTSIIVRYQRDPTVINNKSKRYRLTSRMETMLHVPEFPNQNSYERYWFELTISTT